MFALTSDDASLLDMILLHRSGDAVGFSLLSSARDYRFTLAVTETIKRVYTFVAFPWTEAGASNSG